MLTMFRSTTEAQIQPKPSIHHVIDVTTGKQDCFTPGGRFILRGRGFGDAEQPPMDFGVFVHGSGAVLQRIFRYASWADKEIHGFWPDSIDGPVWLFVETSSGDHEVRSAIHRMPIVPARER